MSKFDAKQIQILEPLFDNKVVLHFSFFANTFPIAYHYSLLLKQKGVNEDDFKNYIKPNDWNSDYPSKSNLSLFQQERDAAKADGEEVKWKYPKSIHVFYTSNVALKDMDKNPHEIITKSINGFEGKEGKKDILFSKYCPRFIFLNNNLYTRKLISTKSNVDSSQSYTIDSPQFKHFDSIKDQYCNLSEVLLQAKSDGIEKLCIYTEIINEAREIFEKYEEWDKSIIYYDSTNISSLNFEDNQKNESKTLDIYFYGAPTSFLFLERTKRFIPLILDKADIAINTIAFVHYNSQKYNSEDAIIKEIEQALTSYHTDLYRMALSPLGMENLNNTRLAYNKYARLIRSDSYFFTPESFVNCIALHDAESQTEISKNFSKPTESVDNKKSGNKNNVHVHFGAGQLGIGLVLPLFKPDANSENRLIVIQKYREEWSKKINLGLPYITLSNVEKWKLKFDLIRLTKTINEFDVTNDSFYLFDNLEHVKPILKQATSISYSLGNVDVEKEFLEFISKLDYSEKLLIFPFENNPYGSNEDKKENKLNYELIFANNPKVKYIKLKADRICLERAFKMNNNVHVDCENHVEVVLNIGQAEVNNLFDLSKYNERQLIFTDNSKKYNFLSDRKKFLVNELHFFLAVYGYQFLLSKGITHWESQYVTIIQSALKTDPNFKIPIETFIRLQIIRLLISPNRYSNEILQKEYNLDEYNDEIIYEHLLKYAKNVAERFNASKEDSMLRIFNPSNAEKVKSKYIDIIGSIDDFLNENKDNIENLPMASAGTFKEYKELVNDVKLKIENILFSRILNFNTEVESKEKEQVEKQIELDIFDTKIKSLLNKNENILIAFDLDGTLFKAKEVFLPAINYLLTQNKIAKSEDELLSIVGMPKDEFEDWKKSLILTTSFKDFENELFRLELQNIKSQGELFEGVIETLQVLKKQGYTLAICTNARKEYLDSVIARCNLSDVFDSDNILYPKKIESYLTKTNLLQQLKSKYKPITCYMIGDRKYDLKAAEDSNYEFVGALYGYAPDEINGKSKHNINSFKELSSIIQKTAI